MNTRAPQALIEKLKSLLPERIAEVEDFVDLLRSRAAEPVLGEIWENDADAAYDRR